MSERVFVPLRAGVVTVSDTRTLDSDTSGGLCESSLRAAGQNICRA